MTHVRNTFLHFLNDNLSSSYPLHVVRVDPSDPSAAVLKMDAVNVEFLDLGYEANMFHQPVAIDVVFDDESTAMAAMTDLWRLFRAAFYTTLYDYSTPSTPVSLGRSVVWDKKVKFVKVSETSYCHYSAMLTLTCTN